MEGIKNTAFIPFVLILSIIHSFIPDHWLPFVIVGRNRKWSSSTSCFYTFFSMCIHILISILLGILTFIVGLSIAKAVGEAMAKISGGLVILLGIMYIVPKGWYHREYRLTFSDKSEGLYLSIVLGLNPCICLLPLFFAVAPMGIGETIKIILVFSIPTLLLPTLMVYFTLKGIFRVKWTFLDTYGDTISGLIIVILGVILILD